MSLGKGRFAPSPTGPLHLGNLRTALLAWLSARSQKMAFILRLDDLDTPRTQPGSAEQIMADLRWLGLDWDEGPDCGGSAAPYRQSERAVLYHQHLQRLLAIDAVYPCYCSRRDIVEAASAPHQPRLPGRYPGTCRIEAAQRRQRLRHPERQPSYRFRLTETDIEFDDQLCGRQTTRLLGPSDDFVVWRADGMPAYQLATVVDDTLMGVTEVVRGADLLDSTYLQIVLYHALGFLPPRFAHVPLWLDAAGRRLAKRGAAMGMPGLRAQGKTPEDVVGMLAASCGVLEAPEPMAARDLVRLVSPASLMALRNAAT